ncbi:UNVERIFIED_CONTAM: hypothetical protein FKN15_023936 [Acipenser sinensis]
MDFVISINPSIILTAFLATSVIFVCFTLSAMYAQRRSYLFLGGKAEPFVHVFPTGMERRLPLHSSLILSMV